MNEKSQNFIKLAIEALDQENVTQNSVNNAVNYIRQAIKQIKNENIPTVEDLEKEFELQKNAIIQPLP